MVFIKKCDIIYFNNISSTYNEHVRTKDTLAREQVSTQDTLVREHERHIDVSLTSG